MMRTVALASLLFAATASVAQDHAGMPMPKAAAAPSTSLTVTLLDGMTNTYSPEQFKALPHVSVHVHNAHNNQDETYSGVPVDALVNPKAVVGPSSGPQHASPNVQVIVAAATDNFHVVITMCDANPLCRSGEAIVADMIDDKPLAADGAFKLVLTEDKKPARWARNLQSLTVRAVDVK
jgi:hypothetical protein